MWFTVELNIRLIGRCTFCNENVVPVDNDIIFAYLFCLILWFQDTHNCFPFVCDCYSKLMK